MLKIVDYLNTLPKAFLVQLGLVLITLVASIDYFTGPELGFSIFYLIPVIYFTWIFGRVPGLITAIVLSILHPYVDYLAGKTHTSLFYWYWNTGVGMAVFTLIAETLTGLKASLEREDLLARLDALTNIANRTAFYELATRELSRSRRYKHILTMVYIGCDNFKTVNDTLGNHTGDDLLRTVATAIQSTLRATDVSARLGGDEFAIILPESNEDSAREALVKLKTKLLDEMKRNSWPVTFSIGAVTFIKHPESLDQMITRAGKLMSLAKQMGKDMIKHESFE